MKQVENEIVLENQGLLKEPLPGEENVKEENGTENVPSLLEDMKRETRSAFENQDPDQMCIRDRSRRAVMMLRISATV